MAKLHFYYAAMNAGKTTTLLQSDYNYRERGMGTLLFTPAIDTRAGVGRIGSRLGIGAEAHAFDDTFDFYDFVGQTIPGHVPTIRCVLLDEAHFLTKKQVHQLADVVDIFKLPVLCYGLRTDFRGVPFEGSQYLLAIAEELTEIKTICHCGKKATMNQRIGPDGRPARDGDVIDIGGNEKYVALCRHHFFEGKARDIGV